MIRLFKITTWLVICFSCVCVFFTLFAMIAVGAAGHSSRNSFETVVAFFYLAGLFVSLTMTQFIQYRSRFIETLAGVLLCTGILFCLYRLYDNYAKGYGRTEYTLTVVPLILLAIVFVGLAKKKI